MQVLCGLQVVFFLFNCQTPVQAAQAAINGETTVGTFTHFKSASSPVSGPSVVIGGHVFY